jgi:hypothetical protein
MTSSKIVCAGKNYATQVAAMGDGPTPAVDWYAWGVTLYLRLEGRLPYKGEHLMNFASTGRLPRIRFEAIDAQGPVAAVLR